MIIKLSRTDGEHIEDLSVDGVRNVAIDYDNFYYHVIDEAIPGDDDGNAEIPVPTLDSEIPFTVMTTDEDIAAFKAALEAYRPDVAELDDAEKSAFYETIGL
jgi:hypothetical protein